VAAPGGGDLCGGSVGQPGVRLQLLIVDNEVPDEILGEFGDRVVLTLIQRDRLIQTTWPFGPEGPSGEGDGAERRTQ